MADLTGLVERSGFGELAWALESNSLEFALSRQVIDSWLIGSEGLPSEIAQLLTRQEKDQLRLALAGLAQGGPTTWTVATLYLAAVRP